MYRKFLVSLDGSEADRGVLMNVDALDRGCLAKEIIFVRVVEPFESPSIVADNPIQPEEVARINAENRAVAERYIKRVVSEFRFEGLTAQGEVLTGKVAETLADYASRNGADLIVLATRCCSGKSRWALRSLSDRILRSARIPVVMVPAPGYLAGN